MSINTEYSGANVKEPGEVFEHASKMVDEAREFGRAVSSKADSFSNAVDLRGRVQRNPLAMVCAAAGIGYILGGGLFSPMTSRLLKVGVRVALIPFIKSQLGAMAGEVRQAQAGPASEKQGF